MKKAFIFIVIFLALALVVVFVMRPGTETVVEEEAMIEEKAEQMANGVVIRDVDYFPGARGFLAAPEEPGQYPGLILIHEWWGLNDNIRDFARDFAEAGYVALAVDLYAGKVAEEPDVARQLAGGVSEDMDVAFANLQAAVDYLKAHPQVKKDALASVGWCFGGGWSYEMAKNDLGVNASVIYYGQFNPEDDLSIMRASILGHFGEEDTSIKVDDVRAFQATLETLEGDHEVFIYPHAGHAFANADNEAAYVPEAAELSWNRTLEFLDEQF